MQHPSQNQGNSNVSKRLWETLGLRMFLLCIAHKQSSHNEFWPLQAHSYEYLCSSKLYKIIMNKLRMTGVKHLIRKNKSQWFTQSYYRTQYYVWKSHMFIWESQKHKEGGGEASIKSNHTNKIFQTYPVILLFQPPMEKILGFPGNFPLKSLTTQWQ